jgi:plasmid stabilization system protein ParE
MVNVSLHAAAEAEYEAALAWYLERSPRAADGFEAAVERALASVTAAPELDPLCGDRHRFCLLRRYPYSLIYRLEGNEVCDVAVAHSRRSPGYWKGRT